MRSLAVFPALAVLGMVTVAQAEVTGTAAVTSDYDFRGVSLSAEDPAIQKEIDDLFIEHGMIVFEDVEQQVSSDVDVAAFFFAAGD